EAGVRGKSDGLNRGPIRKHKGGRDIVLRCLRGGLHERELWIGERRGDTGLIEVGDAESAANDGLPGEQVRDADARAESAPMQDARGAGHAVLTQVAESL